MIIKYIINSVKKVPKRLRILRLVRYIWRPRNTNGQEKCLYACAHGFITRKRRSQLFEMMALSLEATRCSDPVAHFVLSWPTGEHPSPRQVDEAVFIVMCELALKEHQVIYGLHADTDNDHVHLAINLVHPVLNKVVSLRLGSVHEAAHRAIAIIEKCQGWQREKNGRYFVSENGDVRLALKTGAACQPSQRAQTLERRTGAKSAQRIAIETAAPIIKQATSWGQLHTLLAAEGMQYLAGEKGATIRIGNVHVKASCADKEAGLIRLETRLGAYEPLPSNCRVTPRNPEPRTPGLVGWDLYYICRNSAGQEKKRALKKLQEKQQSEKEELKAKQKAERSSIFKGAWAGLGLVLNVLRKLVAAEHQDARQCLVMSHKAERKHFQQEHPPYPDYAPWLLQQNPAMAPQANPSRSNRPQFVKGNSSQPVVIRKIPPFLAVQEKTQVRYDCVEAGAAGAGCTAFVERPNELVIHMWNDKTSLLAALELAKEKWGSFTVTGNEKYKILCAKLAVRYDFKINNPEVQDRLRQEREIMLQKRKAKMQAMQDSPKSCIKIG